MQTDDGAYTDVTNCMLLAAIPGSVGDGVKRTITNLDGVTYKTVDTPVGKAATERDAPSIPRRAEGVRADRHRRSRRTARRSS
jgi:hypothetical protein